MTAPKDIYLEDKVYNELLEKLTKLAEQPFELHGTDAQTEVVSALGEIGGIWPETVLDDRAA